MANRSKKHAPPGITYEPYAGCPFCKGRGCFGCKERKRADEATALKAEQDRHRLEQSLMFAAHYDNPDEMKTLTDVFHADKLAAYYDASDLTEEDVVVHLGKGNAEEGRLMLAFMVGITQTQLQPFPRFAYLGHQSLHGKSESEVRQEVITEIIRQIAVERGDARMKEALRGKPGANPNI